MAKTAILDVLFDQPGEFADILRLETTLRSPLWVSGLVANDPILDQFCQGAGEIFTLKHWDAIPETASNVGDDSDNASTPEKFTQGRQRAVRLERNKSWATSSFANLLAGSDPIGALLGANGSSLDLAQYWANRYQDTLIAVLESIRLDNIANDDADMVFDASEDVAIGALDSANIISPSVIGQAKLTMGDSNTRFSTLVCHSVVANSLEQQGLLQTVSASDPNFMPGASLGNMAGAVDRPFSEQTLQVSQTLGFIVIKDDRCPSAPTTPGNAPRYVSYLFAPGFFRYGEAPMDEPFEVDRKPELGLGSGQTHVFSRRQFILHPAGFAYVGANAAVAGGAAPQSTPSDAQLQANGSFDRVFPRKLCGLAMIRTNG